jgi:hypothetical protein
LHNRRQFTPTPAHDLSMLHTVDSGGNPGAGLRIGAPCGVCRHGYGSGLSRRLGEVGRLSSDPSDCAKVVGLRYDRSEIGDSANEVVAYGTAVTIRRPDPASLRRSDESNASGPVRSASEEARRHQRSRLPLSLGDKSIPTRTRARVSLRRGGCRECLWLRRGSRDVTAREEQRNGIRR